MPRLLPRLVKHLERRPSTKQTYAGPLVTKRRRRRSLWEPLKPPPVTTLEGRTQSLLVDESNIVNSRRRYMRRKMAPPVVHLRKPPLLEEGDLDVPREMSEQEREWWTSPYLRMIASPIRHDVISQRLLPKDFLIRLVLARVKTSPERQPIVALLPDGIQHPRFKTPLDYRGLYITCWKGMKDLMPARLLKAGRDALHPLIIEEIGHLLRLRVLQELEMLLLRLKAAPRGSADDTVLRRLTRSEWSSLKDLGEISWDGAAAVLVVPPVNREAATKQRPLADFSDMPPEDFGFMQGSSENKRPSLPPSALYRQGDALYDEPVEFLRDVHLPHARIPLYNGATFFPLRTQRVALHGRLCEILEVERNSRWKKRVFADRQQREDAPSHAFVLFSNSRTVLRADTVPLAIALWRVRMWEGGGFDESTWQAKE